MCSAALYVYCSGTCVLMHYVCTAVLLLLVCSAAFVCSAAICVLCISMCGIAVRVKFSLMMALQQYVCNEVKHDLWLVVFT